jgi:hypothetical protein
MLVLGLTTIGVGLAAGHGVSSLPAGYVGSTQEDAHGANDVPGQVDVTIMGRDNTQAPKLRIFWSWDAISSWTGTGQTGDACALFDDTDADAFIDYVVCARVENKNANPDDVGILVAATDKPVYIFDCSNKKNDRCTNPAPRVYNVGQVLAGPVGSPTQSGAGNLISELDPFDVNDLNGPGESWPHDSSIDIEIAAALVPANVSLANVCSYPSAGNGGNNNPFDCIVTPGTQYGTLRVTKVLTKDNGGTGAVTDFSFDVSGSVANDVAFEADATNEFTVPVGSYTITENSATGFTTTYANNKNANTNCTNLAVTVGATTICTITNDDDAPSLTLVKEVINDNGGTAVPGDWTLTAQDYDASSPDAGTYNLSESGGPAGYTQTSLTCDNSTGQVTSVTLALGENVTCTFVNDDGKATPAIATDVDAQIRDNVKVTGRGTPSGTVDFFLYSDDECTEEVGTHLDVELNENGEATSDWFNVASSDTYYWKVNYSGDTNNEAREGSCGEAITIDSADLPTVLTGAAGFAIPLLVWAVWSRRRPEKSN